MKNESIIHALEMIDGMLWQVIGALKAQDFKAEKNTRTTSDVLIENNCGIDEKLYFTKKEIESMPKKFRKDFPVDTHTGHIRKRQNSANSWSYEIRYHKHGYNICVSSVNLDTAKYKFIKALATAVPAESGSNAPAKFNSFAEYFFQNYYREKVAAKTFRNTLLLFERWIKPAFENVLLKKVTPGMCKQLLSDIKAEGKGKTADEVRNVLNQVFKHAIAYGIVTNNPIDIIPYRPHERKNGVRLTLEEEARLLTECGARFRTAFAIYLYTGIRTSEIYTVRIEGDFVHAVNSKQKDGREHWKKIPVIEKLRPYLAELPERFPNKNDMREEFHRVLPEHTLKDCRRTFSSHCKECGVNNDAREMFLGHKMSQMESAYTEFTDEFLLSEAKKLCY